MLSLSATFHDSMMMSGPGIEWDDDLWKVFSSWSYEGRTMHDFTSFSASRFDGSKKIDTFSCQIGWLKHDDRL